MSRSSRLTLAVVLGATVLASPAPAAVSEDQAEQIALDIVKRATGVDGRITRRETKPPSCFLTVDGRWHLYVRLTTGRVGSLSDLGFSESPHARQKLEAPPAAGEIEKAGRELMAKVFPDLDWTEFVVESAKPRAWSGCVEARWRQVIPENGFPGPGWCEVVFGWPDRAIETMGVDDSPALDEWRKPPTVTAEEAERIALPKLGDLTGRWVETRKHFCGFPDAKRQGPVWDVTVLFGPEDDHHRSCPDRSVYVDPWSGEITYTSQWDSAPPAGSTAAETRPSAMASSAERSAQGRWLLAAGAAVLVLVLGAAMVCQRRRRS